MTVRAVVTETKVGASDVDHGALRTLQCYFGWSLRDIVIYGPGKETAGEGVSSAGVCPLSVSGRRRATCAKAGSPASDERAAHVIATKRSLDAGGRALPWRPGEKAWNRIEPVRHPTLRGWAAGRAGCWLDVSKGRAFLALELPRSRDGKPWPRFPQSDGAGGGRGVPAARPIEAGRARCGWLCPVLTLRRPYNSQPSPICLVPRLPALLAMS